jgi:hypothetical protein
MKVVAHQHVSMNSHLTGLRLRLPQRQQKLTVSIVLHDQLAVVSALDDVVRIRSNSEARLAGHQDRT